MATSDNDNLFPTSSPVGSSGGLGGSTGSGLGSMSSGVAGLDEGGMPRSPGAGSEDMLSRVVQGAHQTIDRLAETAAPHVQKLQEGFDDKTGRVRELSDEWATSLRTTVRDNPLAAVATAVAVGWLVARLTR